MRKVVHWLGETPSEAVIREFKQRGLNVEVVQSLPANLNVACGAVFDLGVGASEKLVDEFKVRVHDCIDHGLQIQVLAGSDDVAGDFQRRTGEKSELPNVAVGTSLKAHEVAQRQAQYEIGDAASSEVQIKLQKNLPDLKAEDQILLRRAFHDCSRIVLDEMTGGLSDARVFAAHMTMKDTAVGRWPQPDFVKIDCLDKIEREYGNYREYAERFIPFGQRPNVRTIIRGHSRALLRGNFVKGSESLRELAERVMATPAITNLFDDTLKSWHDQAYGSEPVRGSVAVVMAAAGIIKPGKTHSKYLQDDIAGGHVTAPDDLWAQLTSIEQKYRVAPVHGDLHADNVRVQDGRAILIDMASVTKAPVTTDIAALETAIAFNAPTGTNMGEWKDSGWQEHVEALYQPRYFVTAPEPPEPTHELGWITNAVRQLRQRGLAAELEPGEYLIAVAVQLLRRCQWADGETHDIYRRMQGYRIAERLIGHLVSQRAGK